MPRVEIIPESYDTDSGEGTPTIDLCKSCAKKFKEGKTLGNCLVNIRGFVKTDIIGSLDVLRPLYDDDEYYCEVCDKRLID